MSIKKTFGSIAVLVVLMVAMFAVVFAPAQASITGPVSVYAQRTSTNSLVVPFFSAKSMVTSTRSAYYYLAPYDRMDVQYVIAGNDTTSTTLTQMYSNDGTNWVTGTVLLSNGIVPGTDMTQTWNFGRYTSIYVTLFQSATVPVTLTVIAVAK